MFVVPIHPVYTTVLGIPYEVQTMDHNYTFVAATGSEEL
jgi:hypothetical protein